MINTTHHPTTLGGGWKPRLLLESHFIFLSEAGWYSGRGAHLPPLWPRLYSWSCVIAWSLILLLVLSRPCFKGFSLVLQFSSLYKSNIQNSNLSWKQETRSASLWNVHCLVVIVMVIIVIIIINYFEIILIMAWVSWQLLGVKGLELL